MGASDTQTVKAFLEAEAYDGPSLIIAYSHCIAHGYGLQLGLEQQKLAVDSGYWPLFRFDPRLVAKGEVGLRMDSPAPKIALEKFMANETRFGILKNVAPARAADLAAQAQIQVRQHYALYQHLASPTNGNGHAAPAAPATPAAPAAAAAPAKPQSSPTP